MIAIIDDDGKITVKDDEKTIPLSPVEVLFLMEKERLEVFSADGNRISEKNFLITSSKFDKKFETKFIVYKDLRERGYRVKTGVMDLRLYPRGKKPGESESTHYVIVISERDSLSIRSIDEQTKLAKNLRKKLIMGVVDEDGEVTYYNIKEMDFGTKTLQKIVKKDPKSSKKTYHADLLEENVFIWDKDAIDDFFSGEYFGKRFLDDNLQLSLVEAVYLSEQKMIDVYKDGVKLTYEEFLDLCSKKVENFYEIFLVYKDLRENGLIPKTGYKFGIDFRVYDDFCSTQTEHSKYLLQVVPISSPFKIPDMARLVRVANSVRKMMVFAGVDVAAGKIAYININWTKL
ncbi:MAG TPA: tRNA-intron lyase [Halobacteria archaeon]|nr:tRNA-intron lyase [Halobacteria archaeon]